MALANEHLWPTWVDPKYPVTGPMINWGAIDMVPLHYTAAINLIDGDPGEYQHNIPAYLRRIQLDYLLHRPSYDAAGNITSTGYSIGYNMAVDWLGGRWRLRGWGIRCAANKNHNDHTFAILCLVDGQDALTSLAQQAVREIVDEAQARARRKLVVGCHLDIGQTSCPGLGITRQVRMRLFDRPYPIAPLPPMPAPAPTPLPNNPLPRWVAATGG